MTFCCFTLLHRGSCAGRPRSPGVAIPILLGIALASWQSDAKASVERPQQFIAIAFDNCTETARWNELEQYSNAVNEGGARVHFTFFVSGINFLANDARNHYRGPRMSAGESNIGFGGSPSDVQGRVGYINRLRAAGHEIASHAVGHFWGGNDPREPCEAGQPPGRECGANWTLSEWKQEFESFNSLFNNVRSNNGLTGPGFNFSSRNIVGFRAPQLSVNPPMQRALRELGFQYDTSNPHGADPGAWPRKNEQGLWEFGLARIEISGISDNGQPVTNLSMDYNVCASQLRAQGSKCERDVSSPEQIEALGNGAMETYKKYFLANYMGNRAPLHIGHHFHGYQHGVYNKVLLAFARTVCTLPEVRCGTYSELAAFMARHDDATLAAYQRGDFSREGLSEPSVNPRWLER